MNGYGSIADVDIKFGASKKWNPYQVVLRPSTSSIALCSVAKGDVCTAVNITVSLTNLCSLRPTVYTKRLHCLEMIRNKAQPITIDFKDSEVKCLWSKQLNSRLVKPSSSPKPKRSPHSPNLAVSGSILSDVKLENGEILRKSVRLPLNSSHGQLATYQPSESESDDNSDEEDAYESIDKYFRPMSKTQSRQAQIPPPLPKRRSASEIRLDMLYDSVNDLITKIQEIDKQTANNICAKSSRLIEVILVDVSESDCERHFDSIPLPGYLAPIKPKEYYLQPDATINSTTTNTNEPIYAKIVKKTKTATTTTTTTTKTTDPISFNLNQLSMSTEGQINHTRAH